MRKPWGLTAVLLIVAVLNTPALPAVLGTGMTYQGRLSNGGIPVSGTVNLRFSLWDDAGTGNPPVGGTQIGAYQLASNVPVINGVFTTTLNGGGEFGGSAFNGLARWLQIEVCNDAACSSSTVLSPRQVLSVVPYALYALGGPGGSGAWQASGSNIYNTNPGKVGIGTNSPSTALDVRGYMTLEAGSDPALYTGTGTSELNRYLLLLNSVGTYTASGLKTGGLLVSDTFAYANPGKNDAVIKGRVGIGTGTLSFPLTIYTTGFLGAGAYGWIQTDGTRQLGSFVDASGGWLGTRSNNPLYFFTNDSTPLATLATNGSFGIGTTTPVAKLHVYSAGSVSSRVQTGGGTNAWTRQEFTNANGQWDIGTSRNYSGDQFYIYRDGAAGIAFSVQPNGDATVQGTMSCNVLEIRGADIAEKFPAREEKPQPGTVMEIDSVHPGELRVSHRAYSPLVAGVVSGAGNLNAGAVLGNRLESKDGPAIALSGRVWVRCDTTSSAIKPGDLLTTSSTPGCAMKATNRERSHGAVLGKAMSSLKQGEKALVLVLVNLQ